jgi:hypothetical protein
MSRFNTPATASSPRLPGAKGDCPPSIPRRLQALILYRDLLTARTVMDRLARLIRTVDSSRRSVLHPLLWRLDQLDDPRWRESSLVDATNADVIVFAGRGVMAFSSEANRWLESVMARKKNRPLELLALSPDGDPWSITLEQEAGTARVNPILDEIHGSLADSLPDEPMAKSA